MIRFSIVATTIALSFVSVPAFAHSKPVTPADMPRLQHSCAQGNGNDCQRLGDVYRNRDSAKGAGVRVNLDTAMDYLQKGCAAGDIGACGTINRILGDQKYKGYDPVAAYPWFKERCAKRGEEDSSCRTLKKLEKDLRKPKWQKKLKAQQGN